MVRWLLALMIVGGVLMLDVNRTDAASVQWCWDDPIIVVGGRAVSVSIGVQGTPAQVRRAVNAARIRVTVPEGMLAYASIGTNFYFPELVTFQHVPSNRGLLGGLLAGVPVKVEISFDASETLPVRVRSLEVLSLNLLETGVVSGTTRDTLVTTMYLR